jgi:hypothetical protein
VSGVESSPRGAPLMFLVAVLASWVLARAATFAPPTNDIVAESSSVREARRGHLTHRSSAVPNNATRCQTCGSPQSTRATTPRGNALLSAMAWSPSRGIPVQAMPSLQPALLSSPTAPAGAEPSLSSALHAAGPGRDTGFVGEHGDRGEGSGQPQPRQSPPALNRWSADSWLLLRSDTSRSILASRPSYGRSQAGAALRYRFAPSSPYQPQAYLRVSAALAGAREQEAALGLSARPLSRVPLRLAIEARASETASGSELRVATYAVTELPAFRLPFGARGEVYLQGGYVGGEFATPFVDGQVRAERRVARVGSAELSFGAGAWGGKQEGSGRLDAGPTVGATFPIGKGFGRISAYYRFRVAGGAEPSSGPALTLSAGF